MKTPPAALTTPRLKLLRLLGQLSPLGALILFTGYAYAADLLSSSGQTGTHTLAGLLSSDSLSLSAMLYSVLIAMGLGAMHSLSPGHGKTLVGAYLVGQRATVAHALFLGLTVTISHTVGVFALGLVSLLASRYLLPEQLYPWLELASGLLLVGLGATLFQQRLRTLLAASPSSPYRLLKPVQNTSVLAAAVPFQSQHTHFHGGIAHDHREHTHSHGHTHWHGHGHSHLPPADGTTADWRSLLALGISGGLVPCPTALMVLLAAIALHQIGFGLLLILAFSLGLAGVLIGIGLLCIYARGFLHGFGSEWTLFRYLPIATSLLIILLGLGIVTQRLF